MSCGNPYLMFGCSKGKVRRAECVTAGTGLKPRGFLGSCETPGLKPGSTSES